MSPLNKNAPRWISLLPAQPTPLRSSTHSQRASASTTSAAASSKRWPASTRHRARQAFRFDKAGRLTLTPRTPPREENQMAMGQNSGYPPSEHPNPTTKIGSRMGGEFTYQPKWDLIGVDGQMVGSPLGNFVGSTLQATVGCTMVRLRMPSVQEASGFFFFQTPLKKRICQSVNIPVPFALAVKRREPQCFNQGQNPLGGGLDVGWRFGSSFTFRLFLRGPAQPRITPASSPNSKHATQEIDSLPPSPGVAISRRGARNLPLACPARGKPQNSQHLASNRRDWDRLSGSRRASVTLSHSLSLKLEPQCFAV